ncbi:hypothetical protein BaRGS_00038041, partial [Batillaria attramentaria]
CDREDRPGQLINKRQCEGRVFRHNVTGMPVALLQDRHVVFKNVYCARCNGYKLPDLDQTPYLSLQCHENVPKDQHSFRIALASGTCHFEVNFTIGPLFRECPSPHLVHASCEVRRRASCDEIRTKTSSDINPWKRALRTRQRYWPQSCKNRPSVNPKASENGVGGYSNQTKTETSSFREKKISDRTEGRKRPKKRITSRSLCSSYRRVIRVVSDRDRTMYANPDCLACSRGVGDPQILNNLMKDEVSALGETMVGQSLQGGGFPYPTAAPVPAIYGLTTTLPQRLGKVPSFSVFFRLSDTEWSYMVNGRPVSPQIIACPDDQVYVPYYSECEPLDCPPHTFPFRGHCLLEDWNAADPSLQPLPNGTHQVYVTIFTEGPEFSDNNDTTLFSSDLEPNGTLCDDIYELINGTDITVINNTYQSEKSKREGKGRSARTQVIFAMGRE